MDWRLLEVVDIDKMQYGFMSGRGTVDDVFFLRTISENSEPKIGKGCKTAVSVDEEL